MVRISVNVRRNKCSDLREIEDDYLFLGDLTVGIEKLKIFISGLILLISTSALAEQPSGCMVYDGKKLIPDVKCLCVATNQCAKFKQIDYSPTFFNSVDVSGKAVFSEKLKKSYKDSYSLYNEVVSLKANGQGNTPEIKALYKKLDKVNQEIRTELIKTKPEFMAKKKKIYEKAMEDRKLSSDEIKKNMQDFATASGSAINSKPRASSVKKAAAVEAPKKVPASAEGVVASKNAPKKEDAPDTDKEFMLKSVDREKYEVNQDDSLFDIITKTYKKRAYKKLLAP